jgi:DNA (cytosine-5)-methyltransferase 1
LALQALQPAITSHHAQMLIADNTLWEASHGYDPVRVSTDQETSPTLSAKMGTGGNNVPLVGVRRLTPTECERLQGFPDGWTDGQPDGHRYKQLGNAVSVNVAEWIGKRIMEYQNE